MITARNYFDHLATIKVADLPEALRKSHDYMVKYTENGTKWSIYDSSDVVKNVIDLYVGKLNDYLAANGGASAEPVPPPAAPAKNVMVDLANLKVINHNSVPVFANDMHDLLDKFREAIGEKYGVDSEDLHEVESAANDEERRFMDQIIDALPNDNGEGEQEEPEAPVTIDMDALTLTTKDGTQKFGTMNELKTEYLVELSNHYEMTDDDENPMSPYDNFSSKEQALLEMMDEIIEAAPAAQFPSNKDRIPVQLEKFLPKSQRQYIKELSKEGYDEYADELLHLTTAAETIPALYSQENVKDPLVYFHYFHTSNSHWFITEYDNTNDLAFGFTVLNGQTDLAELGYISIKELIAQKGVELDFHWDEKTLSAAKEDKFPGAWPKKVSEKPATVPNWDFDDDSQLSRTVKGIKYTIVAVDIPVGKKGGMRTIYELRRGENKDVTIADTKNGKTFHDFVKITEKDAEKQLKTKPDTQPAPSAVKKTKFSDAIPTEKERESVKFIRRFVSLHGKKKDRKEMGNFIDALQKAITERRITLDDPHAAQITYVQNQLIKGYKWMEKNRKQVIEIVLSDKELDEMNPIAYSEQQAYSVRFLKRYISLDGKSGVKDKAKKLLKDIENAKKSGKLDKEEKFAPALHEAESNLKEYISGKTNSVDVWKSELNGIKDYLVSAGKSIAAGSKRLIEKATPHVKSAAKKVGNKIKEGASSVTARAKKSLQENRDRKIKEEEESQENAVQNRNAHTRGVKYIIAKTKDGDQNEVTAVLFDKKIWGRRYDDMGEWLGVHGLRFSVPENSFTIHKGGKDKSDWWVIRQHPKIRYQSGTFKTISPSKAGNLGILIPMVTAATAAITSTMVASAMKKRGMGMPATISGTGDAIKNRFDKHDFEEANKILQDKGEACTQVAAHVKSPHTGIVYTTDPCHKDELKKRGWAEPTPGELDKTIPVKNDALFMGLDELSTEGGGVFFLKGDIGEFIGGMERNEMAISIEGDEGSGKTQLQFQLADAFADEKLNVWIVELEKNPNSQNITDYRNRYVKPQNFERIKISGSLPNGIQTVFEQAKNFDVIMFDSWGKTGATVAEFGDLRKKYPTTIFVAIFQRRPDKVIRGGNEPKYDADINITTVKVDDTFINNYATTTKTRYGESGKKYNIIYKAIL